MDPRSLTPPVPPRSNWKLDAPVAERTQGLVVSGYGRLPHGRALFLRFGWETAPGGRSGGWLTELEAVVPVTPATPPVGPDADGARPAAALAFTFSGLGMMELPEAALASFSRPFREGMFQKDRLRCLGDRRRDQWMKTVIEGGPLWSANTHNGESQERATGSADLPPDLDSEPIVTPLTVHALLLLYTKDDAAADALAATVSARLEPHGVQVVRQLDLTLDTREDEGERVSREHFGFADGLSQPSPFDRTGAVRLDGAPVTTRRPVQGVPLGEFLIGYENGHQETSPGPVLPGSFRGTDDPAPAEAGLPLHAGAVGSYDFGLNGSYMVVRELRQDVAGFWRSMDENAANIRAREPGAPPAIDAEWLAERVVGRTRDGHLLCPVDQANPDGRRGADASNMPDSDYLFFESDRDGTGCPLGSHVRRSFPRDALASTKAERQTLLDAANNHRILRRGRKFGPRIADDRMDDGRDRGLLFICLNTDIARQFEFVQQTWLLNSDFATLFKEVDPLVGEEGPMTIPHKPLRRTAHVKTFVTMAGGDYFFLPSLPALRYLASR